MSKHWLLPLAVSCAVLTLVFAPARVPAQDPDYEAANRAQQLEQSGELESAFLAYARIAGAEFRALSIARPQAAKYLDVLAAHASELPQGAVHLLRGDLLLALGKQDEALRSYRAAANQLADGHRLSDSGYWVEPPAKMAMIVGSRPIKPFQLGPGSHRDNWLVRRFIALKAWQDVRTEMARVWEIHRLNTRPYRTTLTVYNSKGESTSQQRLVRPEGFNGQGLQFALDYAFFLKQQDGLPAALDVLREPLLQIDMDKNPNTVRYEQLSAGAENEFPLRATVSRSVHFGPFGPYGGISRKEYIRLTWGVFKDVRQAEALEALIQQRIVGGENHLRRVLARVYYHENRVEDALAEELAYIEEARFNPLSTAIRRGEAFEEASRPADAIEEYEKALRLPQESIDRPDPDEQITQRLAQQAMPVPNSALALQPGQLRAELLGRLVRLHGSFGHTDRVFELSLQQIEAAPQRVTSVQALEQAANRASAIGREEQFRDWLQVWARTAKPPMSKASALWVLKKYQQCAEVLATADALRYAYDSWYELFANAGQGPLRLFLDAVLDANPSNARARLDRLELEKDFDSPEAIAALEALLESDASPAFARGKGVANRTRFRNYFDLAYRLMRLYEKHGENDKLVALGMRILRADKPFERTSDTELRTPRADWNKRSPLQDLLDCLYVLFPHVKDPQHVREVARTVNGSECIPLKNQWAKLTSREPARLDPSELNRRQYDRVEIQTLRLPTGVTMLTHRDDVRAIGPAGQWIGTSWGLVRYQREPDHSLRITQIPLGFRVASFLQTPAGLFAGTRGGLLRIDGPNDDAPEVVKVDLDTAYRAVESDQRRIDSPHLLWWSESLWFSDGSAIFRYDPVRRTAQYCGRFRGHPFAAAGTLWVNIDGNTMARYDAQSEEFTALPDAGKPSQLIGTTNGEIWADVYVDDTRRHRPAIINPETLHMRVIPVTAARTEPPLCVNSAFRIVADDGQNVWMLCEYSKVARYNRAEDRLTLAERNYETTAENIGPATWNANQEGGQFYRFYCGSRTVQRIPGLTLEGDRSPYFQWREFDPDRLLLGAAIIREWQEDNLGFDDNDGMSHHIQDLEGGLFEIDTKTMEWQKLGARDGELCDFYVKRIYIDEQDSRAYLCTNGGVSILSLPDATSIERITVSDGLPSNKVEDVVRIGNRLYFACELGDEDGGLAVMDLKTGFIQRRLTLDGLKCNKIKRLQVEGTKLHILYGTLYGVRAYNTALADSIQARGADERVRTFRSSILDTETWTLSEGREVLPAASAPDASQRVPWLGGAVLCDVTYGDKRLVGGTHGLLVLPARESVAIDDRLSVIPAEPRRSLRQQQLADARNVSIRRGLSPDELATWLRHDNPYVRAEAMTKVWDEIREGRHGYTPLLAQQIDDPCDRVAATAVYLLAETPGTEPIEPLRRALKSHDLRCRAVAAISLAQRGQRPAKSYFEEIVEHADSFGNHPFGAYGSVGTQVNLEKAAAALAVSPDPAALEILLKHPIPVDDYGERVEVYRRLGQSLRKRPELSAVLLSAYSTGKDLGPESNYGAPQFAQEVFRNAGTDLLPQLHAALESPDRVVRGNAARACGAIGDPSSIEPLVNAIDLESGYSRASIVWALGELKAKSALSCLAGLYADAKNDERRRQGGGFRMAQASAQVESQYESLSDLDAIRTDWNELMRPATAKPIDPKEDEWLLTPEIILDAVRKVGPESSQTFYRKLAAESDYEARHEAAMRLGECGNNDYPENEPILRNLLGDNTLGVQTAAAVSLLMMGHQEMQQRIVEWLESQDRAAHYFILEQFDRVADARHLTFARAGIQKILRDPGRAWEVNRRAERLLARIPKE